MKSSRAEIVWLVVIVGVALAMRIYVPWSLVFTPTHVNLLETDAWYHLRVIENLVSQFPHRLHVDPFATGVPLYLKVPPLFDWLVASLALIVGGGHPSGALVTTVTAFVPPVLGAMTVVMVYVVARLAAGGVAGLLAAALAATLPGHFLDRTLLGYADHHALEAFVSVGLIWLIARAMRATSKTLSTRSVVMAGVWVGVGLIVFRLTWTSAAMFLGGLVAWLLVHLAFQSWRAGGSGEVSRAVGIGAAIALLCTVLFPDLEPFGLSLQIAGLALVVTVALAAEVGRHGLRAGWWTPRALVLVASAAAVAFVAIAVAALPGTVNEILAELARFSFSVTNTSVIEARPLFMYDGAWSLRPAWTLFRSGFFLGMGAVVFLMYRWWHGGRAVDLLLIVWTVGMYAATIGVNRFGYYLVPAIAVAVGCAGAAAIAAAQRAGTSWRLVTWGLVVTLGFAVNISTAIASTRRPAGVSVEWFQAFDWLRHNTDQPFNDPNHYYARYDDTAITPAASTVMVWWDYGYGLMATARRVPAAIPTGHGGATAARFFTATDETDALQILGAVRAQHVVMDDALPFSVQLDGTLFGKFEAIAAWAGVPTTRFYDTFLVPDGDDFLIMTFFLEDFYKTMTFRLGVLGGDGVTPASTTVISWEVRDVPGAGMSRVVSAMETFAGYDAARNRMAALGPGNHAIVGRDPRVSAVALGPVRGLQRVFATPEPGLFQRGAVQIFARAR
jgi:dolichyl-diphosphooligosaccharide--protein glycosyltransferase